MFAVKGDHQDDSEQVRVGSPPHIEFLENGQGRISNMLNTRRMGANHPKVFLIVLFHEYSPLAHQFLPVFFGLRAAHTPIVPLRDHREDLGRESCKCGVRARGAHSLRHPIALLGCNIRGGRDLPGRINQEEHKDFPATGFGRVLQLEWLDLMLIQVRECDTSVGLGDDITDILDQS